MKIEIFTYIGMTSTLAILILVLGILIAVAEELLLPKYNRLWYKYYGKERINEMYSFFRWLHDSDNALFEKYKNSGWFTRTIAVRYVLWKLKKEN